MLAFRRSTLLLLGGLCALAGCDECPTESDVDSRQGFGIIRGQLLSGGQPISGRVEVERVAAPGLQFVEISPADSNGLFRQECPFGDYVVSVRPNDGIEHHYAADGFVDDDRLRDTLRVDESHPVHDLLAELTHLTMILQLPDPTERYRVRLRLHPQGEGEWSNMYNTEWTEQGRARVEFPGVRPGSLVVSVDLENEYGREYFWLPGTRDRLQAEAIFVPPKQTTTHTFSLEDGPALVQGSIRGSWLTFPDMRAYAWFVGADSNVVAAPKIEREADGIFQWALHVPEPFRVRLEVDSRQSWLGGDDYESATLFYPEPGEVLSDVNFVESGILFDVVDPFYGSLHGLSAEVYRADQPDEVFLSWFPSSSDGPQVPLSGLPQGVYYVRLINRSFGVPWSTQWINRSLEFEGAQAIDLTEPGSVAAVPVSLLQGGTVSGSVNWLGVEDPESGDWRGYYRAYVYLVEAANRETIGHEYVYLGDEPRARGLELLGVRPGDYKIGICYATGRLADTPPDSTVWYPGTLDWEQAETFEVVSEGLIEGVDFTIP